MDLINKKIKQKDWRVSKTANFSSLGALGHSKEDREEHDFYSTDPESLKLFLNKFKLHHNIWEPACGIGHLSKTLAEYGYNVYSSDLVDRGYGAGGGYNFLALDYKDLKLDILTNPPYKYAQEFVEHAMDILSDGYFVVMFLKIQFLEGKRRIKLYEKYKPKYVYVNSKRQLCYKNGDMSNRNSYSSATCYCWFVWEKGFVGEPIIRWL